MQEMADDITYCKKEVQLLRSDKDTLEHTLSMKATEVRQTLANEIK